MKVELYQVSKTDWVSECGEWEVSTKTGKPEVYHLGECIDMKKVDVPDEVEKMYRQLQEKDARIHIRIEKSLKDAFYSKCEKNFQTPSVVLRGLIKKFVEEELKNGRNY